MFTPTVKFAVDGSAGDIEFAVTVDIHAAETGALPGPTYAPLVVDVQNIQVLFVSAINDVLMKIQHMNEEGSFESIRVGRESAPEPTTPTAPSTPPPSGSRKVVPISDYRESLEKAMNGEGD